MNSEDPTFVSIVKADCVELDRQVQMSAVYESSDSNNGLIKTGDPLLYILPTSTKYFVQLHSICRDPGEIGARI